MREEIPLLFLGGCRISLSAGGALQLGAYKGGQGLRGGQSGGEGHHGDPDCSAAKRLAKRGLFAGIKWLDDETEHHKRRDVETEQRANVVALHQAKPNANAGQGEVGPGAGLKCPQDKRPGEKRGGKGQRPRGQTPAGVRDHLHVEGCGQRPNGAGEVSQANRAKEKPGGHPENDQADWRTQFEIQYRVLQQQTKRHVDAGGGAGLFVAEPVQVVPVAKKRAGHLDRVGADRAKRAVVGKEDHVLLKTVREEEDGHDDQHCGRSGEWLEPAGGSFG